MRTFVLITVMLLISVALLAGFLIATAGAQTPPRARSATMGVVCDPASVEPAGDTLLTCTYTITNTGATALTSLSVGFNSNAAPPPDRYYFFSDKLDGVEQPIMGSDLLFAAGDLSPGGTHVLELQTVVRSTHEFAADAVLLADADQAELARYTIDRKADRAPQPTLAVKFFPDTFGFSSPPTRQVVYHLSILNDDATDISVDLTLVASEWRLTQEDQWVLNRQTEHRTHDVTAADVSAEGGRGLTLTFVPVDAEQFAGISPVIVLRATLRGAPVTQAIMADSASLGSCRGPGLGGGDPSALVDGGFGPDASPGGWRMFSVAALALAGGVLVPAGHIIGQRARRHV